MKLTKEQEKVMLRRLGAFGKVMWRIKAIKITSVKVQIVECKPKNMEITEITYSHRLWHPIFIPMFVGVVVATAFMQGIPETCRDVKDFIVDNEHFITFRK